MVNVIKTMCWCGNTELAPYSADYLLCNKCKTLVLASPMDEESLVSADEEGIYGKSYWFEHMEADFGYNNIISRARFDLSERNLHWLKALLKYKNPPGKTLELGCSHGSFVAMLQWAGFNAAGLELSPWVVNFAREKFGIPMYLGRVEDQKIEPKSLDAVILMDVLEHFPDPVRSITYVNTLLKDDGLLLIQTPSFPVEKTFLEITDRHDPFTVQFKVPEHIFLFSPHSVQKFLHECGLAYIEFEDPMFSHYDMFLVASRSPLITHNIQDIEESLQATSGGRLILSFLDQENKSTTEKLNQLKSIEADRAARLVIIEEQGKMLGEVEAERNNLKARLAEKIDQLSAVERDSAARLAVIEKQGKFIGELEGERNILRAQLSEKLGQLVIVEADRASRLAVIEELGKKSGEMEAERNSLQCLLDEKNQQIVDCEADRAARLVVIEEQGRKLGEIAAERNHLQGLLDEKLEQFAACEADRAARLAVIEDQGKRIEALEAQINTLGNSS